jgi:diguanylate cyclase (GGDEF)-like protein
MSFFKRTLFCNDLTIYEDLSAINIHRIYLMGFIMGLINIAHVIVFWSSVPSSPKNVVLWHYLIIFLHLMMLLINGILSFSSFLIEKKRKQGHRIAFFIQGLSVLVNLLFGIFLCVSDQLVTTNINPLLVACIGVAVIFLIPPAVSATLYFVTLVLFFYIVTWTQDNPALLEHVRLNSLTATGMGFGVSWVLWKNQLVRAKQQKVIERQKRELEEKNKYLQCLATHDPLTGLFNRGYFTELVNKEIIRNKRTNSKSSIVLLDIDLFKKINDHYGHPAGDKIIQETANILTSTLRQSDISARLGGEEFIILLPETNLRAGREVAEKLRSKIQDYFFQFDGHKLEVTASFGVAELKDSFDLCYSQADQALYASKKKGRNCVEVFGDSLIVQ